MIFDLDLHASRSHVAGLRVVLLASFACVACAPTPVPLAVAFPSEESFALTNTVRIRGFRGADVSCASLITSVTSGTEPTARPIFELARVDPCVLSRGVAIPDPGPGDVHVLVQALDQRDATVLAGCTRAEVYAPPGEIAVRVSPTETYYASLVANPPTGLMETRCRGGL